MILPFFDFVSVCQGSASVRRLLWRHVRNLNISIFNIAELGLIMLDYIASGRFTISPSVARYIKSRLKELGEGICQASHNQVDPSSTKNKIKFNKIKQNKNIHHSPYRIFLVRVWEKVNRMLGLDGGFHQALSHNLATIWQKGVDKPNSKLHVDYYNLFESISNVNTLFLRDHQLEHITLKRVNFALTNWCPWQLPLMRSLIFAYWFWMTSYHVSVSYNTSIGVGCPKNGVQFDKCRLQTKLADFEINQCDPLMQCTAPSCLWHFFATVCCWFSYKFLIFIVSHLMFLYSGLRRYGTFPLLVPNYWMCHPT